MALKKEDAIQHVLEAATVLCILEEAGCPQDVFKSKYTLLKTALKAYYVRTKENPFERRQSG